MKFKKVQTYIRLFTDLKFAIFVLFLIVFASSLGSIIEQDEPTFFYEEKYPSVHPIYVFEFGSEFSSFINELFLHKSFIFIPFMCQLASAININVFFLIF